MRNKQFGARKKSDVHIESHQGCSLAVSEVIDIKEKKKKRNPLRCDSGSKSKIEHAFWVLMWYRDGLRGQDEK